jgi:hypothetical protein
MRTAAVNPDGPTSDGENAKPIRPRENASLSRTAHPGSTRPTPCQIPVAGAEPRLEPKFGPLTGPNPPRTGRDAPPTWI